MGMGGGKRDLRDQFKIWVGGLNQQTNKQRLDSYFSQFGKCDGIVMMDGATGRSRGFGFVNFFEDFAYSTVLSMSHEIDGFQVRVAAHNGTGKGRPPPGGMGGGMDCGEDAIRAVAGTGLIVIAPNTGGPEEHCSSYEWEDMLLALKVARRQGNALHDALGRADFTRTGIWGYSMGGKTAPRAASHSGYNIKAMLAMHGARHAHLLNVPAMFTTGTEDPIEGPSFIKPEFDADPYLPKIYVNLRGAGHTEPSDAGRLNIWGGRFLSCHVGRGGGRRERHCHAIYGSGPGTLCQAHNFEDCIVLRQPKDVTTIV